MSEHEAPSMDLDLSGANPAIYAALSKAQGMIETVGKDGKNTDRNYKYASAEAMIRGSRTALAKNGLAFISSWTREPLAEPGGDIGNQFVCANVHLHWALVHQEGGVIRGRAELDAIGSRARPPDKAVAATLTYMRGFVLREILNMDRADEDGDAVDKRDESGGWSRGEQRKPSPRASQQRPPHTERAAGANSGAKTGANTGAKDPAKAYREATSKVTDLLERLSHAGLAVDPKGLRVDAGLSATGKPTMGELVRFADYLGQRLETLTYSQAHEDDELPDAFGAGVPERQPGEDDWDDQDHDPTAAEAP